MSELIQPLARSVPLEMALLQLGVMPYAASWNLQRKLVAERSRGERPDTLVLLQHPHTYTLGRSFRREHLLVDAATLAAQQIDVVEVDRGGDVTYHGPGQLVGYPILKLAQHGGDLLHYLRLLEELLIRVLASYAVVAERVRGLTGVWVGDEKIAAIGVKLSASGVTSHGFALNVAPELRFFEQIVPCGIRDRGVTSLARVLGYAPPLGEVAARVAEQFAALFAVQVSTCPLVEDVVC
jgi:lipoyl(octanoyl) transferase